MDPDSKRLRVTVSDGRGRAMRDGGLARWLASVAPAAARGEVAIALVSDARVQALNRQYRRKDYPTDVLSFPPAFARAVSRRATARRRAAAGRLSSPRPAEGGDGYLGDIVIATGVARRQARDAGHSYTAELRVLALHGLLHLLGYDHDDEADRGRMARLEARLRRKGGLTTGLIERELPGSSPRALVGRRAKRGGKGGKAVARSEAARPKAIARSAWRGPRRAFCARWGARAGVGPREH